MGLDASIFMQGAALQNQNAKNFQDQVNTGLSIYAKGKERKEDRDLKMLELERQRGLEVGKLAEAAAYKKAAGLEITPEEDALAQGWDKIRTSEVGQNLAGELYQKNRTLFSDQPGHSTSSGIYSDLAAASKGYQPTYSRPQPIVSGGEAGSEFAPTFVNGSPDEPLDASLPQAGLSPETLNAMLPPHMQGVDRFGQNVNQAEPIADVGQGMMDGSGIGSTLKGRMSQFDKGLDLTGKKEETALGAAGKQAEAYAAEKGKSMAESEAKVQGLNDLNEIFTQMKEDAKGTSSGIGQYVGGQAANALNLPTDKSKADAKFGVGKGFGALNTRIEYLKGQGTISDSEAKGVLTMLPDASDPLPIKEVKLEAAQQYIEQLLGRKQARKPDVSANPGFKYLGVE